MANGQSDPNISLSRNVLDPQRSSRIQKRYKFARDVMDSDNILQSETDRAIEHNEAVADQSFWGRLVGGGLGLAAGLALAPFTLGSSLTLAAAGAGIGSYAVSKVSENLAGGIDTSVHSGGFGLDKVDKVNKALDEYKDDVDDARVMNAFGDAFSVYMAGGGSLKPGSIGSGTGMFATSEAGKLAAHQSLLASGDTLFKSQIKQLAGGAAKNYATAKGIKTAYEAYMDRDKV